MINLLTTPIIYSKGLKLSSAQKIPGKNKLYRIETIPVGAYVKDNAKTGDQHERLPFEVDDNLLLHWKHTFEVMKQNGIEVPMPLNHTEDPEARRATVVDFEIGKNKEGKNALFTIFKFKHDNLINDLKDTSVSIFVPPRFVDGLGNEYRYPIRHVCFTDYPVIPGLEKMQPLPIAASFSGYLSSETSKDNKTNKGKSMPFPPKKSAKQERAEGRDEEREDEEHEDEEQDEQNEEQNESSEEVTPDNLRAALAKLSGDPEHWKEVPDDKLIPALNHIINALMEEGGNPNEDEDEDENEEQENDSGKKGPVATKIKHEEEHYHPPISASHGLIKRERKNRFNEINRMAQDGYLTVPVRDRLVEQFCSDEALQLAFDDDLCVIDNFDETLELIKANGKVVAGSRRNSQNDALALSYNDMYSGKSNSNNPLMRNAEQRAKAAGQG